MEKPDTVDDSVDSLLDFLELPLLAQMSYFSGNTLLTFRGNIQINFV